MHWRFRWEQWRALPLKLRMRKLWQRVSQQHCRAPLGVQQLGRDSGELCSVVQWPSPRLLEPFRSELREWWQYVEKGQFQLFAPCWLAVPERESTARSAFEGRAVFPERFSPWDWQRDLFSGYRWEEGRSLLGEPFPLGVDPRVPWELGRLQFLPALAVLASLGEGAGTALEWARLRLLDFLLQNPPGYGIQWASPLEVALRAVSLQLFGDFSRTLQPGDTTVEQELRQSLLEHGEFLMHHLEWNGGLRGNHYLGNIVGLLSLGAGLRGIPIADTWLAFGVRELIGEVLTQFLPDGGHWEGSVYYHRFALEMVLYGTVLVLALPPERLQALRWYEVCLWRGERPLAPPPVPEYPLAGAGRCSPFPPEYWERLQAAVRFATALTKPNGTAPQIGDHDSGRWLKPVPRWIRVPPRVRETAVVPAPCSAVAELWENSRDMTPTLGLAALLCCECPPMWSQQPEAGLLPQTPVLEFSGAASVEAFPDFGLVVYRWGDFFLAVRCGGLTDMHPSGGHAHCDQLSLELALGDSDILVDPGTYCYGRSAEWRNRFRSTAAHTTLVARGEEQFRFFGHTAEALFWLFRRGVRARILSVDERKFVGEFEHPRYRHRRMLRLSAEGMEGVDSYWGTAPAALVFHLAPEVAVEVQNPHQMLWHSPAGTLRFRSSAPAECFEDWVSPAYGVLQRSCSVRVAPELFEEVRWTLERVR